MTNSFIRLVRLSEEHTIAFKEEMQEAFEHGFKSHCHENMDADDDSSQWQVLPDKDFYQSLEAEGAEASLPNGMLYYPYQFLTTEIV